MGALGALPVHADEPAAVQVPAEITEAIADLSSKEFSRRLRSEQRLLKQGAAAFAPLLAALEKAPAEAGQRIVSLLEQIWLNVPDSQGDTLERELHQLQFSPGDHHVEITAMLSAHHRLREQRAVRALRRLNAIIQTGADIDLENAQFINGQMVQSDPERIARVILPRSWKGTDTDLWHVQRLAHVEGLSVFVIKGNGINEVAQQGMRLGFPNLQVIQRAEVFIGVIGYPFANVGHKGCQVTAVQPNSPAMRAGIQRDDLIQQVDGVAINDFDDLISSLTLKKAYQPIELVVQRAFDEQLRLTLIAVPWESLRVRTPPPPPAAEQLHFEPVRSTPLE